MLWSWRGTRMAHWVQELGEGGHTEPGKPENPRKGGADLLLPDGGELPAGEQLNIQGSPSRAYNLCARLHDGAGEATEKRRPSSPAHLHWLCCSPRPYPDSLSCTRKRLRSSNLAKEQATWESSWPICPSASAAAGQARTPLLWHFVQRNYGQRDRKQNQQYSQQQPITQVLSLTLLLPMDIRLEL